MARGEGRRRTRLQHAVVLPGGLVHVQLAAARAHAGQLHVALGAALGHLLLALLKLALVAQEAGAAAAVRVERLPALLG